MTRHKTSCPPKERMVYTDTGCRHDFCIKVSEEEEVPLVHYDVNNLYIFNIYLKI